MSTELRWQPVCFFLITVIENLPMEMRERLTEMREMDLQVQSKPLFI